MNLFARVRLRLEMWLWAKALPLRVWRKDLQQLMDMTEAQSAPRFAGVEASKIARYTRKVTRRPFFMRDRRCLRQGMLGFHFLRLSGYRPELHFGIERKSINSPRISAHCWVVLDGTPVINDILPDMDLIHIHSPEGTGT